MVVRPFPDGAAAERARIRRQIRGRRRTLTATDRRSAARRMARIAVASAVFRTSRRIGLATRTSSTPSPNLQAFLDLCGTPLPPAPPSVSAKSA